jgi:hypothetical protein
MVGIRRIDEKLSDEAIVQRAHAVLALAAHLPDPQWGMQHALTRYTEMGAALSQISLRDIEDHLLIR